MGRIALEMRLVAGSTRLSMIGLCLATVATGATLAGVSNTKSSIEVGWNAGQHHEHASVMRSERKKTQHSQPHPDALEVENRAVSAGVHPRGSLIEANMTLLSKRSEAAEACSFIDSTGTTSMQCMDETMCNPTTADKAWECCKLHGGRKKCPVSHPLMCAHTICSDEHCCDSSCKSFGGLRQCNKCVETLGGTNNDAYRGCQTVTRSGKKCQRWDTQAPHKHNMTAGAHPTADLRENYCRNPDGQLSIWCFTEDSGTNFEFCDPMETYDGMGAPTCGVQLPLVGSRTHGRLPDDKISASSYVSDLAKQMWRSRMDNTGSTWTAESSDKEPWIQWDFGSPKLIHKVQTKGRADAFEWVTHYKLAFSADGNTWTMTDPVYEGNQEADMVAENTIDPPITASMLRLYPTAKNIAISMRAEIFGCTSPNDIKLFFPDAECCSGTNCDQSQKLDNFVSWKACHSVCAKKDDCVGFQYGKDNEDVDMDRCTAPDLCACWIINGACTETSTNKMYDAFLLREPKVAVRLLTNEGKESHEGRLELYHNGLWGTVCEDGFSVEAAIVVCAQLGLTGGEILAPKAFDKGSGSIWMDSVDCSGHEKHIWLCPFKGWGKHSCAHSQDVGVSCNAPAATVAAAASLAGVSAASASAAETTSSMPDEAGSEPWGVEAGMQGDTVS